MTRTCLLYLLLLCSCCLSAQRNQLKVLQINVWQEGTMIEGGFEAIASEIVRLNPEIVLFSEVRNYNNTDFIARIRKAIQEKGIEYYGEKSTLDVGILSKYKIVNQQPNYLLNNDAGSVLKATIEIENTTLVVYSAHLDYTNYACYLPRGYSGTTWKKLEAPVADAAEVLSANLKSLRDEAIQGVIDDAVKENDKGHIVILGGDFNEPSHLDWMKDTKDLRDHNGLVIPWQCSVMLTSNGFKDAYRTLYPNAVTHPGFTFPSDNPKADVNKLTWAPDSDERDRIDFIYFMPNKKLKLESASVVGPSASIVKGKRVTDDSKDTFIQPLGTWPTDHKAVIATFKLR